MIGAPSDREVLKRSQVVEERVLATVATSRAPFRYRQFRILRQVVLAVGGVLVLGAGAGIAAHATLDQVRYTTACYPAASARAKEHDADQARTSDGRPLINPVVTCTALWATGVLGRPISPAPKMVACIRKDGVTAVFPEEGSTASATRFCAALGMRAATNKELGE